VRTRLVAGLGGHARLEQLLHILGDASLRRSQQLCLIQGRQLARRSGAAQACAGGSVACAQHGLCGRSVRQFRRHVGVRTRALPPGRKRSDGGMRDLAAALT
jgi:hypothetical protein